MILQVTNFFPKTEQCLTHKHTVKKGKRHFRPQPGCHLPNSPWAGIILLFPDENVANLFLQCADGFQLTGWLFEPCGFVQDWVTNKLRELEEQNAHLREQNAYCNGQVK